MTADVLGAVLAGGAGARLGGSKATVELAGRPMLHYPLAAFAQAGIEAIVVAKPSTALPPLDVALLREPEEPSHPLLGLVAALAHAGRRPIVACPCDTPFVTAALLERLAAAPDTAVVHSGGRLHPLLARYRPENLLALREALAASTSVTAAAQSLSPTLIAVEERATINVNTPADLALAERMLR